MTGIKTVGHAGTLDPFASGLLIVGVGREATKEFSKLVGLDKRYRATLRLGATSDTDDRTGTITPTPASLSVTPAKAGVQKNTNVLTDVLDSRLPAGRHGFRGNDNKNIDDVLKQFTGKIMQTPPMYSAKKIKGKKLYELAREGKTVERVPVPIDIYSITNSNNQNSINDGLESEILSLDVHCSSGTYIRALARDIGEALGCGAYLEELKRTAIGPFTISESVKMEELNKENWEKYLISIEQTLERCQKGAPMLGWEQS